MNQRVREAEGVLQMSNQSVISKTRRSPKGWRNGMSNARMKSGRESVMTMPNLFLGLVITLMLVQL